MARQSKSMWIIIDPQARTINNPLAEIEIDCETETVGTYFGALFHRRKDAVEAAARWRGSRVVKVRLVEVTNGRT